MIDETLLKKVSDLMAAANIRYPRMDLVMDIDLMSSDQREDLTAFMDFMAVDRQSPSTIAANVCHDLGGLRNMHLKGIDDGFSPRSSGYAKAD